MGKIDVLVGYTAWSLHRRRSGRCSLYRTALDATTRRVASYLHHEWEQAPEVLLQADREIASAVREHLDEAAEQLPLF